MNHPRRAALAAVILAIGLVAQEGLKAATQTTRPALTRELATIPMVLGNWVGTDEEVDRAVLKESQADDYLNRVYEDRTRPGRKVWLWINYSRHGLNLRHSPEVCLPSGGWTKVESQCQVMPIRCGEATIPVTRLSYSKGELVQRIGFWYYIFGEGRLEHYVRTLPITSRSSHGRTTRGSGLTVEVFAPSDADPEGEALKDFAGSLAEELGPILPEDRAQYHIP